MGGKSLKLPSPNTLPHRPAEDHMGVLEHIKLVADVVGEVSSCPLPPPQPPQGPSQPTGRPRDNIPFDTISITDPSFSPAGRSAEVAWGQPALPASHFPSDDRLGVGGVGRIDLPTLPSVQEK